MKRPVEWALAGSELKLHVQLHAARWLRRHRLPEQRRRLGPDVGHVIGMIQHIKEIGIQACFESLVNRYGFE